MPTQLILSDITAGGPAHARSFLDVVLRKLPAMLFVKDAKTLEYLLWNDAAEAATGWPRDTVIGHTDAQLFKDGGDYTQRDEAALPSGAVSTFESRFTREDGSDRSLRTHRVVIPDATGKPHYILGLSEDVSEGRAAQDRLAFLAGHDWLTHLANRDHFSDRLAEVLKAGGAAAILALDIDDFKAVNQRLGRSAGDGLLIDVAMWSGLP